MLAADSHLAYISEPLNVLHRPGVMRAKVKYWYTYLAEENGTGYLPALRDTLAFHYHLPAELLSLRSGHDFLRMCRDFSIFTRGRLFHLRPLLKDPFAVFSLPWFAEHVGCDIIVTVRHPAGFASSLKRLNWPFDFRDLLAQPLLMAHQLEPYRSRMASMPADDIIGQASLLWAMIYRSVGDARQRMPFIRIVRHEDLSLDPVPGFRRLYEGLGLEFTPAVERTILDASSSENPTELSRKKVHSVKLDSKANLHNWKRRLSAEEIARIRELTDGVVQDFYPDVEWE